MNALNNSTAIPAGASKFDASQLVPNAVLGMPDLIAVMRASKPTIYAWVSAQLLTPPVKFGAKSSAWPASEVNAILAARIAGKTDDEIRSLVIELTEARKRLV
ncbi:helix-turn-helix transcriptional regulator [Paenirhodobacter enshiensis]|uniref:helix-turn-helix transcriptional regulator n=1 Tax=Paenirhodobacter enshiensis TaxID=1105367 RepID=UPI0035AE811B